MFVNEWMSIMEHECKHEGVARQSRASIWQWPDIPKAKQGKNGEWNSYPF